MLYSREANAMSSRPEEQHVKGNFCAVVEHGNTRRKRLLERRWCATGPGRRELAKRPRDRWLVTCRLT